MVSTKGDVSKKAETVVEKTNRLIEETIIRMQRPNYQKHTYCETGCLDLFEYDGPFDSPAAFIARIANFMADHPGENFEIELERFWDESAGGRARIIAKRMETEEEHASRMARYRDKASEELNRMRRQFEDLKAKFGE